MNRLFHLFLRDIALSMKDYQKALDHHKFVMAGRKPNLRTLMKLDEILYHMDMQCSEVDTQIAQLMAERSVHKKRLHLKKVLPPWWKKGDINTLFSMAMSSFSSGDYKTANKIFHELQSRDPDSILLRCLYARSLKAEGKDHQARRQFRMVFDGVIKEKLDNSVHIDGHRAYLLGDKYPANEFFVRGGKQEDLEREMEFTSMVNKKIRVNGFATSEPLFINKVGAGYFLVVAHTRGTPLPDYIKSGGNPNVLARIVEILARMHRELYIPSQKPTDVYDSLERRIESCSEDPVIKDAGTAIMRCMKNIAKYFEGSDFVLDTDSNPYNWTITPNGSIIRIDNLPGTYTVPPSFEVAKLLFHGDYIADVDNPDRTSDGLINLYRKKGRIRKSRKDFMVECFLASLVEAVSHYCHIKSSNRNLYGGDNSDIINSQFFRNASRSVHRIMKTRSLRKRLDSAALRSLERVQYHIT